MYALVNVKNAVGGGGGMEAYVVLFVNMLP